MLYEGKDSLPSLPGPLLFLWLGSQCPKMLESARCTRCSPRRAGWSLAPAPTASPASPHRPSWGHPAAGGAALAAARGVWAGLWPGMPPLFKGSPSLGPCHMAAPSARPEPARPGPRCPDLVPARARSRGGCDRRLGRAAAGAVGQPHGAVPAAAGLRAGQGAVGGWWDPAPIRCPGAAAPRSWQPVGCGSG